MRGRRAALGAVLVAGFCGEFAYALLLFPLLQHYLVAERRLAAGFPGYVLAVYGLARLLTQVPLGGLADTIGRRPAVLAGYAVVLASGLLFWAPGPAALDLGAAALFGLGHALADPLLPAALAEGVGIHRRGSVLAMMNLTQVLGLVLGLAGGAFITDLTPAAVGFVIAGSANGAALALLALASVSLLGRRPATGQRARAGIWRALSNERALDMFVVLLLLALAMNLVLPNISAYSVQRLHRPLHAMIVYLAPAAVIGLLAIPLGGWLCDRVGRLVPLLGGSTVATVGFILLALAHGPARAAVGAALAAAGLALTMPASNVALLEVADVEYRALLLSGMMAVQGLGQALGPLLGGLLAQAAGVQWAFGAGAAALWLVTPGAVLFASTPHDGEPGELVPYTPLTRFISRANIRRHARRAAHRPPSPNDAEAVAAGRRGEPADGGDDVKR